jgi:hypothetical protein
MAHPGGRPETQIERGAGPGACAPRQNSLHSAKLANMEVPLANCTCGVAAVK